MAFPINKAFKFFFATVCVLGAFAQNSAADDIVLPSPQLAPKETRRIVGAVKAGADFLRKTQGASGTWHEGKIHSDPTIVSGTQPHNWPIGYAALPALALLESGAFETDPSVVKAAEFVRKHISDTVKTYELSLAVLLLDRVAAKGDSDIVHALGVRLLAGQSGIGGWGYNCPNPNARDSKVVLDFSKERSDKAIDPVLFSTALMNKQIAAKEMADHSNTQFAVLALNVAKRHGVPVDYSLRLADERFRSIQRANGWSYSFPGNGKSAGAMTCAGLLSLASGSAYRRALSDDERVEDQHVQAAIAALGLMLKNPADVGGPPLSATEPKNAVNYYFLWSVERVGTLCKLRTIGGVDWYKWGSDAILKNQMPNGAWVGRGSGGAPVADTSFALLFLRKSDPLPDLRKELAKRVKIVDPGPPELKAGIGKEGKVDPKKAIPKPKDEKPPSSAQEGPPSASLGKVQVGQATELPLKVRGPEAFRILKIEGTDGAVKVDFDKKSREVHELAVTVKGAEPGELRRTLTLVTDLPDLREVEIRVVVQVQAAKSP